MNGESIKKFGFRPTTGLDPEDVFVESNDGEYVRSSDYDELIVKLATAVRALEDIKQRTFEPSYRMGSDINRIAEMGLTCAPEFHSNGKIGGDEIFAYVEVKVRRNVARFVFGENDMNRLISPQAAMSSAAQQVVITAFKE